MEEERQSLHFRADDRDEQWLKREQQRVRAAAHAALDTWLDQMDIEQPQAGDGEQGKLVFKCYFDACPYVFARSTLEKGL